MSVGSITTSATSRGSSSLRVSVHIWGRPDAPAGSARRDRLRAYRDLGVSRVILQGFQAVADPGHLERVADDCAAVGALDGVRSG